MVDGTPTTRSSGLSRTTSTSIPASRRKAIRSNAGCITCRARKVKCDERVGGSCLNCERLHLECQRADGTRIPPPPTATNEVVQSSESAPSEGGLKRKRTFRSCAQCRSAKARCSGDRPACSRCKERRVFCAYDEDSAPQWERIVQSARVSDTAHDDTTSEDKDATSSPARQTPTSTDIQSPSQITTNMSIEQPSGNANLPSLPPPARSIVGQSAFDSEEGPDSLDWLFKPHLPSRQRVRMLVKEYFEHVHPLRCYAFIHRPSFLQRIEESSNEDHARNGLLHVVCALGAKFYALQYSSSLKPLSSRMILSAGNEWAKKAQLLLAAELGMISVQNLMSAVLLHDHEIRVGNYAGAFVLTGTITRMAQALQLNLEYSTDIFHDEPNNGPTVCSKEARRRLMWSCYILDTLIGSGVDQLTLFSEPDIKIQLPCNERNFVLQVPCVTEMLPIGQPLPFISPKQIPPRVIDNIGIVALYVRLIALRKQVLRYTKQLETVLPPWLPESEFAKLDNALHEWYQQLPPSLQFTRAALYTRRESSQLGAFVLLQCTYNWTTVDLYRIALPKLYRLRPPWKCSEEFRARLQETIFIHAQRCSTVLADASRHGITTLADTWLPTIAFDGNRLMLYYITQILGLDTEKGQTALADCMPYCRSNLELLKTMQSMSAMAESLYPTAKEMLKKATTIQQIARSRERGSEQEIITRTRENTPDHNGPDYVLQPTTVYRMARDSIATQEKHAFEKTRAQRLRLQTHSAGSNSPMSHSISAASRAQPPNLNAWISPSSATGQLTPLPPNTNMLQLEPTAPPMHEFDNFFSANGFDGTWQPAETAATAFDASGLPAWLPAMTDMYADLNAGPWPMGTDIMNGYPGSGPGAM